MAFASPWGAWWASNLTPKVKMKDKRKYVKRFMEKKTHKKKTPSETSKSMDICS